MVNGIIDLRKKPTTKGFATVGEQLARRKELPLPIRLLSSPFLTGGLLGTLGLLKGTFGVLPALGIAGGVPTVAGVIRASPRAERLLKEKIFRPEEFGERIGGFIEEPTKPFEKPVKKAKGLIERIRDKPLVPALATAGIIAGGIASAPFVRTAIERIRERGETTALTQQLEVPTLIADLPSIPSPIGAVEVPVEAIAPQIRQPDINISVKPNINVEAPKNEVFINNIIQNI